MFLLLTLNILQKQILKKKTLHWFPASLNENILRERELKDIALVETESIITKAEGGEGLSDLG